MIPWLKSMLYDEQSFANLYRAAAFIGLGILNQSVDLGKAGWWGTLAAQGLTLAIKAGDRNVKSA